MFAIAHAGHWALGLLEAAPLIAVAAVVTWRAWAQRTPRSQEREPVPHA